MLQFCFVNRDNTMVVRSDFGVFTAKHPRERVHRTSIWVQVEKGMEPFLDWTGKRLCKQEQVWVINKLRLAWLWFWNEALLSSVLFYLSLLWCFNSVVVLRRGVSPVWITCWWKPWLCCSALCVLLYLHLFLSALQLWFPWNVVFFRLVTSKTALDLFCDHMTIL